MSKTFRLEIVSPIKHYEMDDVEYLRAPGTDGLFGVQAGHAPSLIALNIGEIKITRSSETTYWSTSGGFVEIGSDMVKLLVETVESAGDIDVRRAEASLERARTRLNNQSMDEARTRMSLLRALNRLSISKNRFSH